MEVLNILEKRVLVLVECMHRLQQENVRLQEEKQGLLDKVETLERSLLTRDQHTEERNRELAVTKELVDHLIRSIDGAVERGEGLRQASKSEIPQ